jgi:hypothetical protein
MHCREILRAFVVVAVLVGTSSMPYADAQTMPKPVGFAPSDSTQKYLENAARVEGSLRSFGPLTNVLASADQDPRNLLRSILIIVQERAPDARLYDNLAEAKRARLGTTIVGDVRVTMGTTSFTTTTVEVNLLFLDRSQKTTARYTGRGSATIPYPAFTYGFKSASDQALAELRQQLAR